MSIVSWGLGQSLALVVYGWTLTQLTTSTTLVTAFFALRAVPRIVIGIPAGRLADHIGHSTSLRLSNLIVFGVIMASAILNALVPSGAAAWILGSALLLGCCDALRISSMQALVNDVSAAGRVSNGLAAMNLVTQVTTLAGSLVGGVLLGPLGLTTCLFLAAICHPAAALCRVPTPTPETHSVLDPEGGLVPGVRSNRSRSQLVRIAALIAFAEIFLFSTVAILPSFVQKALDGGPFGLGLVLAAEALGGAAVLVVMTVITPVPSRTTFLMGLSLGGIALLGQSVAPTVATLLPAIALLGAALSAIDTTTQSVLQANVTVDQRSTAAGVWVVAVGVTPVDSSAWVCSRRRSGCAKQLRYLQSWT